MKFQTTPNKTVGREEKHGRGIQCRKGSGCLGMGEVHRGLQQGGHALPLTLNSVKLAHFSASLKSFIAQS